MHDAEQRMVLKAMLTRDINECFVCDTVDMLATMLKRSSSGWSHHILFIEPTDASGSEDKALLALVAKIRQIEEDNSILHKMSIVGVMAAADPVLEKKCVHAGINVCISKPLTRQVH